MKASQNGVHCERQRITPYGAKVFSLRVDPQEKCQKRNCSIASVLTYTLEKGSADFKIFLKEVQKLKNQKKKKKKKKKKKNLRH